MRRASRTATLVRMSPDSSLLVRRWPERRPVVLGAAALGFAAVGAAVLTTDDPALGVLYVVPVMLAALELGLAGGLAAATIAAGPVLASGAVTEAVAPLAVAAVAGRFSDRMRAAHAREQRLLESALTLAEPGAHHRYPAIVAAAALRTPRAAGARVELDGAGSAVAGRMEGRRTGTPILARGAPLGRITVAYRVPLAREDRAALELLALQVGLAADNQRLLDQRSGLGRLLDAQEDDRSRLAETLHEELAQVLAAVLIGLRMLRRHGADDELLDELQAHVVGVLERMRGVATSLRPSSLAQLGLVPALEARDDVAVEAAGLPEPLPEPLRTGVYRLVEHMVSPGRRGARVQLSTTARDLDVVLDVDVDDAAERIGAVQARAALLNGTVDPEPLADGRTRLRVRLPLGQDAREGAATPTGRLARTTVLPGAESMSS
jgi:signal transduction histidine kinase